MKNIPKDLTEANDRIVAYINKLIKDGHSEKESYFRAMQSWIKIKSHFADPIGSICGNCITCKDPILHQIDECICGTTDAGEAEMWHLHCYRKLME
jgi:hypothetical protein